MPGIDPGTISRANLGLLLEDLRVDLDAYFAFESYGALHNLLAEKGTVDVWDTPAGVPSNGHRSNSVAIGQPLPKGNLAFTQKNYDV